MSGTFCQGQGSSIFEQPKLGCVSIQVAFISSGSGQHSLWSPSQQGGGTLRKLGALGETFIFPELYHFFHNTTLPSRWKVPAGSRGYSQCAFVLHRAPAQAAGCWTKAPPFLYQPAPDLLYRQMVQCSLARNATGLDFPGLNLGLAIC